MNIVINVVGYKFAKPFITAFTELNCSGLINSFFIVDSAMLPMGRNMGINATYEKTPDFTHILFIDDDMSDFTAEHLRLLINANKPIVSGIFTSRRPPYNITTFKKEPDDLKELLAGDKLLEVDITGMAFTLVQRQVLDDVKEEVINSSLPIWFTCDRVSRSTFSNEVANYINSIRNQFKEKEIDDDDLKNIITNAVIIGQTSHIGTCFIGEDVSFCYRAKLFGHKTYLHPKVRIGHLIEEPVNTENREGLCKIYGQQLSQ